MIDLAGLIEKMIEWLMWVARFVLDLVGVGR